MKTILSQRSVNFLKKSIATQAEQYNSPLTLAVQQLSMGNFTPLENYLKEKLLLIDDPEMRSEIIDNFFVKIKHLIQLLRQNATEERDFHEMENMEKAEIYLPLLMKKFRR